MWKNFFPWTFNAKKESLNSKKSSTETLLKTESVILKRYQNLLKVGAVAEIQMLQQKNKVVNLKSEFDQLQSREKEISSNYKQNIENIRKIEFFPSDRIDIEFRNKKKIRYPVNYTIHNMNFALKLLSDDRYKTPKVLDLRIPNKVITYD